MAQVLIPWLSGLQQSVPWLPGAHTAGFFFQKNKERRHGTHPVSSLIYCRITHLRQIGFSKTHTLQNTRPDGLSVAVEEGTMLPSLAASGAALLQHHHTNPNPSSLLCSVPKAPVQLLASDFHVQSLPSAWRLLPLPPEGPRVTVCAVEMNILGKGPGHRALLPSPYPQLVLKSHSLPCSSESAAQTLPMLNSICLPACNA